jgi:hypothetical protein
MAAMIYATSDNHRPQDQIHNAYFNYPRRKIDDRYDLLNS